jgi:hypothetical protein
MKDLGTLLRDADPLDGDPGLSSDEAQAMRRAMLRASRDARAVVALWPRPLAVAALVVLTLAVGIAAGVRLPPPAPVGAAWLAVGDPAGSPRRQLQFATPGGTRIIWVFDPDFRLNQEVMP